MSRIVGMTTALEYKDAAARTMRRDMSKDDTHMMLMMGMAGEVGEVLDILKKIRFHGATGLEDKLREELGDVLWYTFNLYSHRKDGRGTRFETPLEAALAMQGRMNEAFDRSIDETDSASDPACIARLMYREASMFDMSSGIFMAHLVVLLCDLMRLGSVEDIMSRNVAKLRRRYPQGFSTEASMARADEAR